MHACILSDGYALTPLFLATCWGSEALERLQPVQPNEVVVSDTYIHIYYSILFLRLPRCFVKKPVGQSWWTRCVFLWKP